MQQDEHNRCRKAATECLQLAKGTKSPETKRTFLIMARQWLRLAAMRHSHQRVPASNRVLIGELRGAVH
jgi:hypothetical protein